MTDETESSYDVVVVGGGPAGLSGALTLARARRSVLVVDAGEPRNAPAAGVHGFLSRDGVRPAELARLGLAEVRRYGGTVVTARVVAAAGDGDGFTVTMEGGRSVACRRLLVTTGLVDELPDIPGVRERWGREVVHCPYCHGWEVRDQVIGILATGPFSIHQALLFSQWTPDVVLFLHNQPRLSAAEAEEFAALEITVVTGEVKAVEVVDDRLTGVRLDDGRVFPVQAVAVGPRFTARTGVLATLGLEPTPHPRGIGEFIAADPTGLTALAGVWVAGNVTDLTAQVLASAAGGSVAGAAINAHLITEDTQRAVAARRQRLAAASETGVPA